MNKKTLDKLQEKLEKQRENLEESLEKFAKKDEKLKGNWNTKFPRLNGNSSGQDLETAADEVEEYETLLPLEHSLELELRDVNNALEKIKKENYGKCENCKKDINEERLEVNPSAKFCISCEKKK